MCAGDLPPARLALLQRRPSAAPWISMRRPVGQTLRLGSGMLTGLSSATPLGLVLDPD